MAACEWRHGKHKSVQAAKAQFGHSVTARRKAAEHTNLHINKSLTKFNFSINGLSYQECCDAYEKRLGEIDLGKPGSGKNARTVMQSVIIYPPAALAGDRDRLRSWFEKAGEIAKERFGKNLIDISVHFDEVHQYMDPDTKEERTSREHAHAWFVPEVDGRLNGKLFSSLKTITGFNTDLHEMSLREFGCPMMDGSKKGKGGNRVEYLKAESVIAEAEVKAGRIIQEAQDEAARIIAEAEEKEKSDSETRDQAWDVINQAYENLDKREAEVDRIELLSAKTDMILPDIDKKLEEADMLLTSVKMTLRQCRETKEKEELQAQAQAEKAAVKAMRDGIKADILAEQQARERRVIQDQRIRRGEEEDEDEFGF